MVHQIIMSDCSTCTPRDAQGLCSGQELANLREEMRRSLAAVCLVSFTGVWPKIGPDLAKQIRACGLSSGGLAAEAEKVPGCTVFR